MRGDLIRKLNFPKWIIVIATTSTALINLGINLIVLITFSLINGVTPSLSWLLVPISIIELYALALGVSFALGSINVKYRDIGSIWDVLIQALFYCAPIIYPISMVATQSAVAAKIILLNPIAQTIQDIRHNLITDTTITTWGYCNTWWVCLIPIVIVIVVAVTGSLYFRKKSKYFAEEV
jgi:ABC-2 type transport system permease protein